MLDLLQKVKKTRDALEGATIVAPFSRHVLTKKNKIQFNLETQGTDEIGLHFWVVENSKAHWAREATPAEALDFYSRHFIIPGILAEDYIFVQDPRLNRNRFPVENLIDLRRLDTFGGYDCAYSGNVLVPIRRTRRFNRRILDQFLEKLSAREEDFRIKHGIKAMYDAYYFLLEKTVPTLQERIQEALDFSGSTLISYTELPNNQIRVTYRTGTGEYTSVFDIDSLRVIRPGVCIRGNYDMYTLPAMIDYGVNNRLGDWVREAYRTST